MIYIDKYAYFSGLKETKPLLKILFGGVSLIACICSRSFVSFAIVLGVMAFLTIFKAKIPLGYYVKLLLIPLCFLVFSVIGLVVNITSGFPPPDSVLNWKFGGYNLFVSSNGIALACRLACKSMAAVTCLYFIILTTPFRDIIYFLSLLRCPKIMITLMTLIYQFIFLLMEVATIKMNSQLCRGGYRRMRGFTKNFAMLWGSVFIQACLKSEWVYKSMAARHYEGNIKLIPRDFHLNAKDIGIILFFFTLVMIPNYFFIS